MPLFQIDSLDTLALLGDRERFTTSIDWIGKNLRFDIVSDAFFFFLDVGLWHMQSDANMVLGIEFYFV